jgi:hypothetical protein
MSSQSIEQVLEAHIARCLRNQIRVAGVEPGFTIAWWERLVESTRLAERWECWDSVQGRWRKYWRRHGSLPRWAQP